MSNASPKFKTGIQDPDRELVTAKTVARCFGVSQMTATRWRLQYGMPYMRIRNDFTPQGWIYAYDLKDVEAWGRVQHPGMRKTYPFDRALAPELTTPPRELPGAKRTAVHAKGKLPKRPPGRPRKHPLPSPLVEKPVVEKPVVEVEEKPARVARVPRIHRIHREVSP
jgi:hypothetical protein